MSLTSGFFDAMEQGEGNYDRVYTAAEFAHYFSLLVGNGVFPSPDTGLNVLASDPASMTVKIGDGSGWINGYFVTVAGGHSVTLEAASGAGTRIDSIIMQWNSNDRKINIIAKSGTASGNPQPVTLQRDAELWELELAQITVGAGVSSVDQTKIKDMRSDETRCGLVTALLKGIDPSSFLKQSEAEFNQWFETVMNKISSEDVAGSLLKMITEVDNREKEHYAELSALTDKASKIKSDDSDKYKSVHTVVKIITPVVKAPTTGHTYADTAIHAPSKRVFFYKYNPSENTAILEVYYKNMVTNKWSTHTIFNQSTSYYSWTHILLTNGDYVVTVNNYHGIGLAIYKITTNSDGSISSSTIPGVTLGNRDTSPVLGQPMGGIPRNITRFLLSQGSQNYILDVTVGTFEIINLSKQPNNGRVDSSSDLKGLYPFILSNGATVLKNDSGFTIFSQDKKEYFFSETITGQGCIDTSGKHIYIPVSTGVLVISADTYEKIKTISTNNVGNKGIFSFDKRLYTSELVPYKDETFQKMEMPATISESGIVFGEISSNYTNTLFPLGTRVSDTSNPKKYNGVVAGDIVLHRAVPVFSSEKVLYTATSNTCIESIIALGE